MWGPYEKDPKNPIVTSVPGESYERQDPDHLKPKYYNPDSLLQKSGHGSYVCLLYTSCHYHAVPETCAVLEPKGLYLVDSGGQYLEGTTDITRTFALGPVTEEEKKHYTICLLYTSRCV